VGGQDLEEGLRVPPVARVRRPRRRRHRGTGGRVAAPGQRRVEHHRPPHHVLDQAFAQLHEDVTVLGEDGNRAILVRTDAAGATHGFAARIHNLGMQFSLGASLQHFDIPTVLTRIPKKAWTPAYNGDGNPRDGAWVAEVTGMIDLSAWPEDTRLILRKERPTPARNCGSLTPTGCA